MELLDLAKSIKNCSLAMGLISYQILTRLRSLIVEEVVDLTSLANLSALQSLAVSRTQVSDLSVLTPLISRGCPVRWSSEVWRGPGIYVEDCPLTTPPPEIVQQERRHP